MPGGLERSHFVFNVGIGGTGGSDCFLVMHPNRGGEDAILQNHLILSHWSDSVTYIVFERKLFPRA